MASLLIVEDDEALRETLCELFAGCHLCHAAATAEEALDKLAGCDYDVIVTDLSMPGMSGECLLGYARVNCPRTPVLFISGSTDEERTRGLLTKGAFGFLQKPFQLPAIYEQVALAFEERRRRLARA